MCVPGVQACAVDGNSAVARSATTSIPSIRYAGELNVRRLGDRSRESGAPRRGAVPTNGSGSDAELLPAAPDSLAKVAQLVLDDFADGFARGLHVLLHALLNLLGGDAIPHL